MVDNSRPIDMQYHWQAPNKVLPRTPDLEDEYGIVGVVVMSEIDCTETSDKYIEILFAMIIL
jgi:hypothetical protein